MALKKPSDFFGKDSNNKKEILVSKEQKIPENFDAYKDNLKNVKVLNEFTENFGSFGENIEKINLLEESILELKEEIKNTLSQEDLDNAMMSNLLILEENIISIQNNLEGINQQNLQEIYEEVESVISNVEKIADQLPVYNNLIKSNEISLDKKLITYQKRVQEELVNFDNTIDEKISSIEEKLVSDFENHQNELKEEIVRVNESVQSLIESEIPKYQHLLTKVKIENDEKVQEIVDKFSYKIKSLTENAQRLNDEVENKSKILDESFTSEIKKLEEHILNVKKEAEETSSTYKNLYNAIEAKGLRDTNQFSALDGVISNLSDEIKSVYTRIEETKEYFEEQETIFQESYQEEIKKVQNQFSKKINLLENDIETKNKKIKDANEIITENLVSLKEKVESLPKLQKDYNNIQKKLNFIEEAFNKINEKTLLKEDGSLLTGTEKEKTKDPITPLDKNFVTFDDLSNHYRQFINRVQIQLASIGGGGETRLEFLDDIDRSTAKINGRFLKYDAASDKWVGAVGGGGGSQTLDDTLGLGNTSSIGMSVGVVTATSFYGDGSPLSGVVTTIIAGGGIYIDQSSGSVTITNTRDSGGVNYWNQTAAGIHTLSSVGIGTTAKSDFKLFVEGDAKVTGILTVGNQSVTIDGSNNTIKVGSGVTINGNTGIISATAIYVAGSQVSTFSGNYNDLTNKPDLSTISVAYASTAGIATYATTSGISTSVIGGIGSITQLRVSGVSTLGITTFTGAVSFGTSAYFGTNDNLVLGNNNNLQLYYNGSNSFIDATNGPLIIKGTTINPTSDAHIFQNEAATRTFAAFLSSGTAFYNNNNTKLEVIGAGITVTGTTFTNSLRVSGVTTSTGGFVGDLTGNASSANYATTAGVATALQNSRTFQITGDVVASAISFDGSGNVSLAATIQPNSVGLGTDTTGDYVQSVSGTANQITVTSGTGEGSSPTLSIPNQFTAPQDVTVTRDLQVDRNLNVNGNITIGGTSATLFTTEFKVYDPDIVLGFRTDGSGNDTSTDTTANHGGIAIASTEGTPLISLYDVGIGETNPATYKKFMWFKSGTFSGLGTDAWISNYAIGIGSTQVPNGVRLAAGGMQVTDNTLRVPQLNISGVTTSTGGFVGNVTGTATTATVAQGLTGTPNITVGVVTATSFVKSGGTSNQFLKADGSVDSSTYLTTTGSGTNLTGIVTSIVAGTNVTISGSTGQVTINASGGGVNYWNQTAAGIHTLSNVGIGTTNPTESGLSVLGKIIIQQDSGSNNRLIFRGQPGSSYRWNIDNYSSNNEFRIFREDDATSANGISYLGISTTGTVTATRFSGDGSLLTGITAAGSGVVVQNQGSTVGTAGTLNFSTNLTASFSSGTATISLSNNPSITGILTADQVYTSNNGNGTNVRIGDDLWIGDINVANTTRFSGAQDSTKAFVVFGTSDAVALGRTGTGPLYYGGNFNVSGVSSATSFSGSGTNLTGIVTSIVAGDNVTISGSTGQVTISATGGGGGGAAALDILEVMMFA